MRWVTFLARRFVAGERAAQAVEAARRLNEKGFAATLNFLGEEVKSRAQAQATVQEYLGLLGKIAEAQVNANVSVKPSQLGLGLDGSLCRDNLARIVEEAARLNNFIRLDMEGSLYTQKTLDLFRELIARHQNLGVAIQAYLRRSLSDIEALNRLKARVRLCKGAYREPASVAFQSASEVNRSFDALTQRLLLEGNSPGLATHDDRRIEAAVEFAQKRGISPEGFEFQMLYGLRRGLWSRLAGRGYRLRIYVPYGTHWFPYFYRRLRERKENWMFALRNILRG